MHLVALEARKERAWNSPEAQRRRECAQVNDDVAGQALRDLTDAELSAHIRLLDADHQIKRAALQTVAASLARALNEKLRRGLR